MQSVYGFGSDSLGLLDFRVHVEPGDCDENKLNLDSPTIKFQNTRDNKEYDDIVLELIETDGQTTVKPNSLKN